MAIPSRDSHAAAQAGIQALGRGECPQARQLLSEAAAAGATSEAIWLAIAAACRGMGDDGGRIAAIDKALALAPRGLQAHIAKGDALAEGNNVRAATAFYKAALRYGASAGPLSSELTAALRRARAFCEQQAENYAAHLRNALEAQGLANPKGGRFSRSLDLMVGKKRLYFQEPLFYYFPELPQIQFYERSEFPWLDSIEAAIPDIRAELSQVLTREDAFTPYVEANPSRPVKDNRGLLGNPDWSAFYLWKNGRIIEENGCQCPKTMTALAAAPFDFIPLRTPSILFSMLRPHTRIPPHNGFVNVRLICHLPLIVPEKCGFRVGNETREWVEGETLIFDDTIEHEAWNDSDRLRVILLFDIWRPELSEEERRAVTALFEVIDAEGGDRQ